MPALVITAHGKTPVVQLACHVFITTCVFAQAMHHNDDAAQCLAEIRAILAAERLRRFRQLGLAGFVRDMLGVAG